ncbi:hypothetical protein BC628DRAFT_911911 [Trametes gibbosa]|nr:hypothetical protein BC628DRAFT_911911 [Trametes gibbosa]
MHSSSVCSSACCGGALPEISRQCLGCPVSWPMLYCSKEYQHQDWVHHQRICKIPGKTHPPPPIPYGRVQRRLRDKLNHTEPFEHLEIMAEDEDRCDPLNREIKWEVPMPCDFGLYANKMVRNALQRYTDDLLWIRCVGARFFYLSPTLYCS